MLAFLYVASLAVVLCIEVNVVRVDRLSPRSLLTPFTDDVVLTSGDRRAYRNQAQAQRTKGFERVEVTFAPPTPPGGAPSGVDRAPHPTEDPHRR